eukprot:g4724.t1
MSSKEHLQHENESEAQGLGIPPSLRTSQRPSRKGDEEATTKEQASRLRRIKDLVTQRRRELERKEKILASEKFRSGLLQQQLDKANRELENVRSKSEALDLELQFLKGASDNSAIHHGGDGEESELKFKILLEEEIREQIMAADTKLCPDRVDWVLNAGDIKVGDRLTHVLKGPITVRWIGHFPELGTGTWLGVELDHRYVTNEKGESVLEGLGNHDGSININSKRIRKFTCKPRHGLFCRLQMLYGGGVKLAGDITRSVHNMVGLPVSIRNNDTLWRTVVDGDTTFEDLKSNLSDQLKVPRSSCQLIVPMRKENSTKLSSEKDENSAKERKLEYRLLKPEENVIQTLSKIKMLEGEYRNWNDPVTFFGNDYYVNNERKGKLRLPTIAFITLSHPMTPSEYLCSHPRALKEIFANYVGPEVIERAKSGKAVTGKIVEPYMNFACFRNFLSMLRSGTIRTKVDEELHDLMIRDDKRADFSKDSSSISLESHMDTYFDYYLFKRFGSKGFQEVHSLTSAIGCDPVIGAKSLNELKTLAEANEFVKSSPEEMKTIEEMTMDEGAQHYFMHLYGSGEEHADAVEWLSKKLSDNEALKMEKEDDENMNLKNEKFYVSLSQLRRLLEVWDFLNQVTLPEHSASEVLRRATVDSTASSSNSTSLDFEAFWHSLQSFKSMRDLEINYGRQLFRELDRDCTGRVEFSFFSHAWPDLQRRIQLYMKAKRKQKRVFHSGAGTKEQSLFSADDENNSEGDSIMTRVYVELSEEKKSSTRASFAIFVLLMLMAALAIMSGKYVEQSFYAYNAMQNELITKPFEILVDGKVSELSFTQIRTEHQMWQWMKERLMPFLLNLKERTTTLNNNEETYKTETEKLVSVPSIFTVDRVIGDVSLRQVRTLRDKNCDIDNALAEHDRMRNKTIYDARTAFCIGVYERDFRDTSERWYTNVGQYETGNVGVRGVTVKQSGSDYLAGPVEFKDATTGVSLSLGNAGDCNTIPEAIYAVDVAITLERSNTGPKENAVTVGSIAYQNDSDQPRRVASVTNYSYSTNAAVAPSMTLQTYSQYKFTDATIGIIETELVERVYADSDIGQRHLIIKTLPAKAGDTLVWSQGSVTNGYVCFRSGNTNSVVADPLCGVAGSGYKPAENLTQDLLRVISATTSGVNTLCTPCTPNGSCSITGLTTRELCLAAQGTWTLASPATCSAPENGFKAQWDSTSQSVVKWRFCTKENDTDHPVSKAILLKPTALPTGFGISSGKVIVKRKGDCLTLPIATAHKENEDIGTNAILEVEAAEWYDLPKLDPKFETILKNSIRPKCEGAHEVEYPFTKSKVTCSNLFELRGGVSAGESACTIAYCDGDSTKSSQATCEASTQNLWRSCTYKPAWTAGTTQMKESFQRAFTFTESELASGPISGRIGGEYDYSGFRTMLPVSSMHKCNLETDQSNCVNAPLCHWNDATSTCCLWHAPSSSCQDTRSLIWEGTIAMLEESNWVDDFTSAIILHFNLFNVNNILLIDFFFIFEVSRFGNTIVPSYKINLVKTQIYSSTYGKVIILAHTFSLIVCFGLFLREILSFLKQKNRSVLLWLSNSRTVTSLLAILVEMVNFSLLWAVFGSSRRRAIDNAANYDAVSAIIYGCSDLYKNPGNLECSEDPTGVTSGNEGAVLSLSELFSWSEPLNIVFCTLLWAQLLMEISVIYKSKAIAIIMRSLNRAIVPTLHLIGILFVIIIPMIMTVRSWFGHRIYKLGHFGKGLTTFLSYVHRALGKSDMERLQETSTFLYVDVLALLVYLICVRFFLVPIFKAQFAYVYNETLLAEEKHAQKKYHKHHWCMFLQALFPAKKLFGRSEVQPRKHETKKDENSDDTETAVLIEEVGGGRNVHGSFVKDMERKKGNESGIEMTTTKDETKEERTTKVT